MQFIPGIKVHKIDLEMCELWNDLGFSLCVMLPVCHVVTISDDRKKSEMGVGTDLVCHC